jgi:hypothetical protein
MKRFRLVLLCAFAVFIAAWHSDVAPQPRTEFMQDNDPKPYSKLVPRAIPTAPEPRAIAPAPIAAVAPPARAVSPDPRSLIVPPAVLAQARELVTHLGSDDFATRETAAADLARLGGLARPALLEAVNGHPRSRSATTVRVCYRPRTRLR